MATFTFTPDFGSSKTTKPNITTVKFGDGYEQRVGYGLNLRPRTWNLVFANRDSSEIDSIEEFLEARITSTGVFEAFDWTPIRASSSVRVRCEQWDRTYDHSPTDSLKCSFVEVFEP